MGSLLPPPSRRCRAEGAESPPPDLFPTQGSVPAHIPGLEVWRGGSRGTGGEKEGENKGGEGVPGPKQRRKGTLGIKVSGLVER